MGAVLDFDVLYHICTVEKCANCHLSQKIVVDDAHSPRIFCFPLVIFLSDYLFILRSEMKANVCGVKRMAGTAKSSGNAYDMCNVTLLVPIEIVNNAKMQINGAGFSVMEMPLAVESLPLFMNQKFPVTLDLETDVRLRAGKPETVVVGIKSSLPKAA